MMIGDVRITLLPRNETYSATLPYASCKGIMIGTLSMEYGGQVIFLHCFNVSIFLSRLNGDLFTFVVVIIVFSFEHLDF